MIQFDAETGFWTIKHLTCGATFQITGDKIIEENQTIKCSNCGISLNLARLKDAVANLSNLQRHIELASIGNNDQSMMVWQVDPPIYFIEDEED